MDLLQLAQTEALDPSLPNKLDLLDVAFRIAVAAILGFFVGWERKIADKPAGRRTMALISAGAAAFTIMGAQIAAEAHAHPEYTLDPTRVLSYIISGVGFLGAGAILHSKRGISGLTTAAAIWASAGIGAASGLGLFNVAGVLFGVVFCVLWVPWLAGFVGGNDDDDHDEDESEHQRIERPEPEQREHVNDPSTP